MEGNYPMLARDNKILQQKIIELFSNKPTETKSIQRVKKLTMIWDKMNTFNNDKNRRLNG